MASVQQLEAAAVLSQLSLLAVAISIGHYLRQKRVLWIGGAGTALLLGVFVGIFIRLAETAPLVDRWMTFQADFFLLVLLPPIMFDACFDLDAKLFLKNIGSVCMLAFVGTTTSTFAIGFNMWLGGRWKLCYGLSIMEALTFGALISATDPVTVLAVFQALGANPDLYMNVFGESVLNDAVAMVLFEMFGGFATHEVALSVGSIFTGIVAFFGIFLGSTALGIGCGLGAAALLKTRWYYTETNIETGLMLLIGYGSYMAGTALGLSGVVCVVFCAMVAGTYAAPNLSPAGLSASRILYRVLASCMELFVFCYIGISLFMQPQEWHFIAFTAVSLFGLAWSRAANVVPCCAAINYSRPPELAISKRQQLLLWWSGLRGAMAFALSVEAMRSFPGETGKIIKTCTFMTILLTVLVNGGGTGYMLAWFGLTQQNEGKTRRVGAGGVTTAGKQGRMQEDSEKTQLLPAIGYEPSAAPGPASPEKMSMYKDTAAGEWAVVPPEPTLQASAQGRAETVGDLQLLPHDKLQQRQVELQSKQHGNRNSTYGSESRALICETPRRAAVRAAAQAIDDEQAAAAAEDRAELVQQGPAEASSSGASDSNLTGVLDVSPAQRQITGSSSPKAGGLGSLQTLQGNNTHSNNNSLQAWLDHWSTRYLEPWLVNAESARAHLAEQLQQQSRVQGLSPGASSDAKDAVQLYCRATGSLS